MMVLQEWAELFAVPVDSGWWEIREGSETGPVVAQVRNEGHARRIVACVNACEGIPTEALEAGVVREMVEALEWFMRRSGLDEGDEGDGLLIPAGDTAEIKRRFGAALERVRGGDRSA